MKIIRRLFLFSACLFLVSPSFAGKKNFILAEDGMACPIVLAHTASQPLRSGAEMLAGDIEAVTGAAPQILDGLTLLKKHRYAVVAGIPGTDSSFDQLLRKNKIDLSSMRQTWEAYRLQVVPYGKGSLMLVIGSDVLGTVYGLLELSRSIGVSPWIWWADSRPEQRSELIFPIDFIKEDRPSVQFRGIFLNDEDFGLMPWATKTFDPQSATGAIGPKTYEQIFRLLLRLRANTLWPAMHECTAPFYTVPGNQQMAAKYGIYVGTSHCEPLMRNNTGEWDKKSMGDYDYTINADRVSAYWKERVEKVAGTPCFYTVGMRGIHDGRMQGAKTNEEQKALLEKVFVDQRKILYDAIGKPLNQIPQVFIPYKEVLDVYDTGLEVPEDVTLMWCDDNYGNMTRLSSPEEQKRSGGAGVYYHISYWGRPHDYLWLATTSPAQIRFEMQRAWDYNARKIWILNVGDIKPAEYLSEFYLDLAWNVGKDTATANQGEARCKAHLNTFMEREFGPEKATAITKVMQQYYHLANLRKPEFMGWSRVEESKYPGGKSPVFDTEFSPAESEQRIQAYARMEREARRIGETMTSANKDAYFQLVLYPVVACSQHNMKMLYAQQSRQAWNRNLEAEAARYAAAARHAYQEIERITKTYNDELANSKWNRMMNYKPRNLAVFMEPDLPLPLKDVAPKALVNMSTILRDASMGVSMNEGGDRRVSFPASACLPDDAPASGLGHSQSAVRMKQGEVLEYTFYTTSSGAAELSLATLPNYAPDGGALRYEVFLNNQDPILVNTQTRGRSEAWKLKVLRNQLVTRIPVENLRPGTQVLRIRALDDDVLLDQILLDFQPGRKEYLFPCTRMQ